MQESIDELDQEVCEAVNQHPQARRFLTHPEVGPITALATEVFLGDPLRFADGKAVASYIGMFPSEHPSRGRQRLGAMSKQGNALPFALIIFDKRVLGGLNVIPLIRIMR